MNEYILFIFFSILLCLFYYNKNSNILKQFSILLYFNFTFILPLSNTKCEIQVFVVGRNHWLRVFSLKFLYFLFLLPSVDW